MPICKYLGNIGSRLFTQNFYPKPTYVIGVCSCFLLWGACIYWGAEKDGVLHIPAPNLWTPAGKGLCEHYGFQMAFLSGPLVLITLYYAVSLFLRIANRLSARMKEGIFSLDAHDLLQNQINSLLLRSKWRYMLYLLMIVTFAYSLIIFKKLDNPVNYWGNDVFNACAYPWSYYIANAYLCFLWWIIYPLGVFYGFHITYSAGKMAERFHKLGLIKLDFLHTDSCGGMAQFGQLNTLIMVIYIWPICAVWALSITHTSTYISLIVGAIVGTMLLTIQSLLGLYLIGRVIRIQKEEFVAKLNDKIESSIIDGTSFDGAIAIMQYRDKVLAVSEYPYSQKMSGIVNVLRFTPTAIALVNYVV